METPNDGKFLSLDKLEDQLIIAAFVCLFLSLYFGLQPWPLSSVLWAGLGVGAFICMYFAFSHMWPYGLLLCVAYAISAFGVILPVFWSTRVMLFDEKISVPVLVGIFLILAAFYIAFYVIQYVKKTRDAQSKEGEYLPLGFWSISVVLFVLFSLLSIYGWTIWVNSHEKNLQYYLILEPVITLLLIYILWYPDRNLDWSIEKLPEAPAAKYFVTKSKVLKEKVAKVRNVCPECGLKLKKEKKTCPSCDNTQVFGWCMKSEAYALPCTHCGAMNLHGKEKCGECGKELTDSVACSMCKKSFSIKEWKASPVKKSDSGS